MKEAVNEKRILAIDINYLPSELKDKSIKSINRYLEKQLGEKVLVFDGSRANIGSSNESETPIFYIK